MSAKLRSELNDTQRYHSNVGKWGGVLYVLVWFYSSAQYVLVPSLVCQLRYVVALPLSSLSNSVLGLSSYAYAEPFPYTTTLMHQSAQTPTNHSLTCGRSKLENARKPNNCQIVDAGGTQRSMRPLYSLILISLEPMGRKR